LNPDNLRNTVRHISLISLFALGEAVVIIAGGIDLSIGSIICVSAVTTSYLTMYSGFGIVEAVAAALALSLLIGYAQGLIITRLGLQPFVVTLASMLLLRGAAEVMTGGTDIGFQGKYPGFRFLGEGIGLGMPMPFWFALIAIAIVAFLMHRTILGRYAYAIGSNPEAAVPRLGLRAPRGGGRRAGRLLAARGAGLGVRGADRRRDHADHVQRREPDRQVALAERRGGGCHPGRGDRRSHLRAERRQAEGTLTAER
jgi:hypothetical protein